MSIKRAKLNEKIKFIKRIFQTPYHFFYIGIKSNLVGVRFEDKQGRHFEFTGPSMFSVVTQAEKYVADELAAGNLVEPNTKKDADK